MAVPAEVEAYIVEAQRAAPRTLAQHVREVAERFGPIRGASCTSIQGILARHGLSARLKPATDAESSVRPVFENAGWLAEIQRRVIAEGRRESRTRRDPSAAPLRPVHAILRDVPWR